MVGPFGGCWGLHPWTRSEEKKQNKTKTLIDDKPESAGGFTHELAVEKLAWQNQEQNPDGYFWNEFGWFWEVLVEMFAILGEKMTAKFGCEAKSDNDKKIQRESNLVIDRCSSNSARLLLWCVCL